MWAGCCHPVQLGNGGEDMGWLICSPGDVLTDNWVVCASSCVLQQASRNCFKYRLSVLDSCSKKLSTEKINRNEIKTKRRESQPFAFYLAMNSSISWKHFIAEELWSHCSQNSMVKNCFTDKAKRVKNTLCITNNTLGLLQGGVFCGLGLVWLFYQFAVPQD